jgi:hypothetical protein
VLGRDDARIVRELAIDELRDELDRAEAEGGLRRRKLDANLVVALGEKLRELEHRFSRHDDLLPRQLGGELERRKSQPVAISRHELEAAVLHHHEKPVQVIADVLLRHRVLHEAKQVTQLALAERKARALPRGLRKPRKILRGQRLQRKAAFAGAHEEPLVLLLQGHLRILWQRAQDIDELARPDGKRSRLGFGRQCRARGNLNLDIRSKKSKRLSATVNQHIGEDRQRMAALDDAAHRGQWSEDLVAFCFHKDHIYK